eukprot:TRINITY_DN11074_c0_g1_i1.p1 TRINITY_DN11074_c0_g1~~TRINITY_DN11074_c0_g1_i1.p1  ORF type:complete len:511 (-),score=110.53 TRINITY_DN11074_c0_g1_i1:50-1582(-)
MTPPSNNCTSRSTRDYKSYLLEAREVSDWSDIRLIDALHIGRSGGPEEQPVVMVAACRLNVQDVDMWRVLLYVIDQLDQVVNQPYIVVYSHYNASAQNQPDFKWLRDAQRILDARYKRNLSQLIVLDPGLYIKTTLRMLKPFISVRFWRKVKYVKTCDQLCLALEMQRSDFDFCEAAMRFERDVTADSMGVDVAACRIQSFVRGWLRRLHVKRQKQQVSQVVLSFSILIEPGMPREWTPKRQAELVEGLANELCLRETEVVLLPCERLPQEAPVHLELWPRLGKEDYARQSCEALRLHVDARSQCRNPFQIAGLPLAQLSPIGESVRSVNLREHRLAGALRIADAAEKRAGLEEELVESESDEDPSVLEIFGEMFSMFGEAVGVKDTDEEADARSKRSRLIIAWRRNAKAGSRKALYRRWIQKWREAARSERAVARTAGGISLLVRRPAHRKFLWGLEWARKVKAQRERAGIVLPAMVLWRLRGWWESWSEFRQVQSTCLLYTSPSPRDS